MLPDSTKNAKYEVTAKLRRCTISYPLRRHNVRPARYPKADGKPLKARLVTYKDPLTGKLFLALWTQSVLRFQSQTYRYCLYKKPAGKLSLFQEKSNRELRSWATFSQAGDEGIKTASLDGFDSHNMIFRSVIHKRIKEQNSLPLVFNGQSNF